MTADADWDYFADGSILYEATLAFRQQAHVVDHPADEPLIASRTFCYHDRGHPPGHLPTNLVDYYRCWPPASPDDPSVVKIVADESVITRPVVIYTDGTNGILGEGNHRLAAAKELGQTMMPVVVIPDRLNLTSEHVVVPIEDEVSALLGDVIRRHHGVGTCSTRHQLSTHTDDETVYVFCVCGAHWRRPVH